MGRSLMSLSIRTPAHNAIIPLKSLQQANHLLRDIGNLNLGELRKTSARDLFVSHTVVVNPAPLVCKQENEQLWTSLPTNYNYANMFISVSKETVLFTVILDSLIQVYKLEVSDNMASSGALIRNEVLLTALSRKLKETCRVTVQYKSRSSGNIPELKPHDRTTEL